MAEPKVRFKKDDGSSYPAWRTIPMSEVFTEISEKNHPELPVLSVQQGVGTVLRDSSDRNILYDKSNLKNYKAMKKDDYIIHLRSFEGGLECSNYDGISSPAYRILRSQAILPAAYRDYFRSYEFIHNKLAVSVVGIRDGKNIDMDTFWQIPMSIPCIEEQQKIADFLYFVDEVISTSEQEVANLETQKKAVMKKVFSQEVRFKRTDGTDFPEWGKQTLGNLAEFSKGQGYTKSDLSETGSPIILYGRLYTKYQTVISEVDTFAEMKPRSVLSKKGDVIVPASGETAEDISVAAVVDVDGIILGGDLNIIHPCNAILPDYLAYALTFGTPHQEMAKRAQGKSIVHLHNDDLKSAVIVYPCIEEQRLIADFLSDFDEAIAAAKSELELWKELKKGLLQQLFV